MGKLKVGFVGCGGIAQNKHLKSLAKINQTKVAAFCDIDAEIAEMAKNKYGTPKAKVFTDYKELMKMDLDAVYVCTPNRSHAEITIAALDSGKHVMCEKPMAMNFAEAKLMCEAAKRNDKILTIAYQNRWRNDAIYAKKECEAGVLGEIYYAKAKAIRRRAVPTWGVFLNEYEQGGGPLIDIGTHALDLTLWCMDNYKPKSAVGVTFHKLNNDTEPANAFGPWNPEEFTVEDSAFGFVTMENGAVILIESSWALNTLDVGEATAILSGTKGGAEVVPGKLIINGVRHDRMYEMSPVIDTKGVDFFDGNETTPDVREQLNFLGAIQGECELVVLPEQAAVVTQILEAIYESAKIGKQVYFS